MATYVLVLLKASGIYYFAVWYQRESDNLCVGVDQAFNCTYVQGSLRLHVNSMLPLSTSSRAPQRVGWGWG